MVIYIDILLFVNIIVNFAILMTTERLLKRDISLYRMLAGAVIGALFSLMIFIDSGSRLFLLLLRLLSSAATTLTVFGRKSRREFLRSLICQVAVATVYCGFFILFYELFKPPNMVIVNDVLYLQVNPLWLTGLTAFIYIIILLICKLFRERIKSTVVPLDFTVDGKRYACIGKIDTGCNLREPFSSAPVIIADTSVFRIEPDAPARIIPYTAISGSSYLRAKKADSVTINKRFCGEQIYIASGEIAGADFQAVINSDIAR